MGYLLFAWIASFVYGLEVFVSKLVAKHSLRNPWLFNFVWSFFILILTLPLGLSQGFNWPNHWLSLLLAGLFYTLSGLFYLLALYKLDISVLSPLFNLRTIMSVLLGVLLLQEKLSGEQTFLIAIIFILAFFITLDEKLDLRSFFQPAVGLALLSMISLSLMSISINKSVRENGYWTTTLFLPLINQLVLLLSIPKFQSEIKTISLKNLLVMALIALLGTIGSLASNKAYGENVSLTAVIISLPISMWLAIAFSILKPSLLENHSLKIYLIRLISAALMIASALRLSQVI